MGGVTRRIRRESPMLKALTAEPRTQGGQTLRVPLTVAKNDLETVFTRWGIPGAQQQAVRTALAAAPVVPIQGARRIKFEDNDADPASGEA